MGGRCSFWKRFARCLLIINALVGGGIHRKKMTSTTERATAARIAPAIKTRRLKILLWGICFFFGWLSLNKDPAAADLSRVIWFFFDIDYNATTWFRTGQFSQLVRLKAAIIGRKELKLSTDQSRRSFRSVVLAVWVLLFEVTLSGSDRRKGGPAPVENAHECELFE